MSTTDEIAALLAEGFTTDALSHRESPAAFLLVRPEPSATPGRVDVVVSARSRHGSLEQLPVTIVSETGERHSGYLNHRGQVRFTAIAPGHWRGETATGTGSAIRTSDVVVPFLRLQRRLAPAAATGVRDVRSRATTADGTLTVELEETDEGRLVATIISGDEQADSRMVDLVWRFVAPRRVEERHRLVTPLAARRGEASARYDLGPAADVHELHVLSVDWVTPSEVESTDVSATFGLTHYGSAQRAWQALLDRPDCPDDLRALLAELLR